MKEVFDDKSMEEIMVDMVDMNKIDIAGGLIHAAKSSDPSALKILQGIMDRFGGSLEKDIDLTDEQFKEIIRIGAQELCSD